jgi:hypothetical protein
LTVLGARRGLVGKESFGLLRVGVELVLGDQKILVALSSMFSLFSRVQSDVLTNNSLSCSVFSVFSIVQIPNITHNESLLIHKRSGCEITMETKSQKYSEQSLMFFPPSSWVLTWTLNWKSRRFAGVSLRNPVPFIQTGEPNRVNMNRVEIIVNG